MRVTGDAADVAPSRGLSMAELHQLIGALYLEITWLRKELERVTADRDGGPTVG